MRTRRTSGRGFRIRAPRADRFAQTAVLGAALWAGAVADVATAGPTGETIVHGNVTFVRNGDRTLVYASDGSIINYFSFNILPWETVRFIQPGSWARVLNRVTGPDPTVIQGILKSNGQVYVVNPSGVYFDGSAVVNTAGILAAAGNISDQNFLAGIDRFTGLTGDVTNHGTIRAEQVHLAGAHVANHGSIRSGGGMVTMLAGDSVYLRRHGERMVARVDGKRLTDRAMPWAGGTAPDMAAQAGVLNTGTIDARRGQVVLGAGDHFGLAIHNLGSIAAERGDVTLAAADGLVQNDGMVDVSTEAGRAGSITMQGPSVLNRGELRADSDDGRAGFVELTSTNHTYMTSDSRISAAGGEGLALGGEVLVHSYDGVTVMADGSIVDVSGGLEGGHGGFAEISGLSLTLNGTARADAKSGWRSGTIFIDPFNIIIDEVGGDDSFLNDGIITFFEGGSEDAYIAASTLQNMFGLIHMQAQGSIFVDAEVNLDLYNVILFEAAGTILVREPITGARSLRFFADFDGDGFGYISVSVPLSVGEDIFFSAQHIRLNGGEILTGTSQTYLGDVWLGVDNHLAGTDITFFDRVDTRFDQPARALDIDSITTTFHKEVGGNDPLLSLDVSGTAQVDGGLVRTTSDQDFRGRVRFSTDTLFESLSAGRIHFHNRLDGAAAFVAATQGVTRFDGKVGLILKPTSFVTDAGGETQFGANVFAGSIDVGDDASLLGSVALNSDTTLALRGDVAGNGHDLDLNAPTTILEGASSGIGRLRTDAAGTTELAGADVEADRVLFRDAVFASADSAVRGASRLEFLSTLDGPGGITVSGDGPVIFNESVGGLDSLAWLDVETPADRINANSVHFHGGLVRAVGDISFSGRNAPARVATVAAHDDLVIRSVDGDVSFGENAKLTGLGNLEIRATNGTVRLADAAADGDLEVRAAAIELDAREGGRVRSADGSLLRDGGSDLVATGRITFSVAPTITGSGDTPYLNAGAGANAALSALPRNDAFQAAFVGSDGMILDPAAHPLPGGGGGGGPTPPPPPSGDGPDSLATALSADLREQDDDGGRRRVATPVDGDLLPVERLALYLNAFAENGVLSPASVARVIDRNARILLVSRSTLLDRPVGDREQADPIRAAIANAWGAYQADEARGDLRFRDWLARSVEYGGTLVYLRGIGEALADLRAVSGDSAAAAATTELIDPIRPAAMQAGVLEAEIGVGAAG